MEIFDPLSQAWGSALWRRQRHQFAANQFAYNAGRCRAHAIMTIRLQRWRYSMQGVHSVAAFFDEVNAFPSVDWPSLDNATCEGAQQADRRLLMQRYRNAVAILADSEGAVGAFRAACGDRQGDAGAAQRYVLATDPALATWHDDTATLLELGAGACEDPWSERMIQPRHAQYADDTARVGAALTVKGLVTRVTSWNETMPQYTEPMGIAQNAGKQQLVFDVNPPSTDLRNELIRQLFCSRLWKQNVMAGKHLGCYHEVGGGCDEEVHQAVGRATAAWHAYHFFWMAEGIADNWKGILFKGLVFNTLISGLETICLWENTGANWKLASQRN